MVMKVTNGVAIDIWFDNWYSLGPLNEFIRKRDIYEANLKMDTKVVDMNQDGNWIWPTRWVLKWPQLLQIHNPVTGQTAAD